MLEGAAQKKSRLGSDSDSSFRRSYVYLRTITDNRFIGETKLYPAVFAAGRKFIIRSRMVNSSKQAQLLAIGENDAVNILFDCTDGYKTCKLFMLAL
jgi:hypothetical protein